MKGKFMTVAALLAATAIGWHGHHGIVKNSRTKIEQNNVSSGIAPQVATRPTQTYPTGVSLPMYNWGGLTPKEYGEYLLRPGRYSRNKLSNKLNRLHNDRT